MLVLTYQREFTKGHWRKKQWELPIHGFYEIYKDDVPLFFNLLTFFLPLASADRAFRDYSSIEEILNATEAYGVDCSENKILEVIHFADSVRDVPLIRPFGELQIDKCTGKARGADAFGKEFANLGHRSGYTRNVTVRGCRRWALMQAGKNPDRRNTISNR
jgi:carbonic anhydrase